LWKCDYDRQRFGIGDHAPTPSNKQKHKGRNHEDPNPQEKEFLDVFLHEATTSPFFHGPASKALYGIGVEYRDISFIAWAYEQDVSRTSFEWGHAAEVSPPLPWADRDSVLRRNKETQGIWEQKRRPVGTATAP
jgi:hypothetical protein